MQAEILSTGDEIRSGTLVDSNSAHISQVLEQNGVYVRRHACVGDSRVDIAAELLRMAGGRARVVVVTGGLGPTADDVTAAAAAEAAGVPLATDAQALEMVTAVFQRLQRPMSDSNLKQARLPVGSRYLSNPKGTAPGFELTLGSGRFFFLPGVPSEMKAMLEQAVVPRIHELHGGHGTAYLTRTLASFGLPESVVGERLAGLEDAFPRIRLGLRARFPEIHVKLYAGGPDPDPLTKDLDAAAAWVQQRLGTAVFSQQGDSMAATLGALLRRQGASVAAAESCTGGLVANWLTDVPGSSDYFLFSAVTYANQAKLRVLDVPEAVLAEYGAVHEETARCMAVGARRLSGATYAVATSGIAGPAGGTPDKPVGTVCIGLATPEGSRGMRYVFRFGGRYMKKRVFAMQALDVLRRELLGRRPPAGEQSSENRPC